MKISFEKAFFGSFSLSETISKEQNRTISIELFFAFTKLSVEALMGKWNELVELEMSGILKPVQSRYQPHLWTIKDLVQEKSKSKK